MALTAPRTWVDDEVPPASTLNTHIRDNMAAMRGFVLTQTEDIIDTGTTLVMLDLPGLEIYGLAGETWCFMGTLYYSSASGDAISWSISTPIGTTGHYGGYGDQGPKASTQGTAVIAVNGTNLPLPNIVAGGNESMLHIGGTLIFARRGLVKIQGTKGTGGAGTTIIYRDSFIQTYQVV